MAVPLAKMNSIFQTHKYKIYEKISQLNIIRFMKRSFNWISLIPLQLGKHFQGGSNEEQASQAASKWNEEVFCIFISSSLFRIKRYLPFIFSLIFQPTCTKSRQQTIFWRNDDVFYHNVITYYTLCETLHKYVYFGAQIAF